MHCAVYHFVLRRIVHCHTNTRTQIPLVSPGNLSTVSVKSGEKKERVEQMASKWLKPPTMVPTSSPILLLALSLICWLLFFFSPIVWIQPSLPLQCHPGSQFVPKRLRLTGSPMERHKVSQEEKERREGGQGGEERWRRAQGQQSYFQSIADKLENQQLQYFRNISLMFMCLNKRTCIQSSAPQRVALFFPNYFLTLFSLSFSPTPPAPSHLCKSMPACSVPVM